MPLTVQQGEKDKAHQQMLALGDTGQIATLTSVFLMFAFDLLYAL